MQAHKVTTRNAALHTFVNQMLEAQQIFVQGERFWLTQLSSYALLPGFMLTNSKKYNKLQPLIGAQTCDLYSIFNIHVCSNQKLTFTLSTLNLFILINVTF
jgi:hypothetical protein